MKASTQKAKAKANAPAGLEAVMGALNNVAQTLTHLDNRLSHMEQVQKAKAIVPPPPPPAAGVAAAPVKRGPGRPPKVAPEVVAVPVVQFTLDEKIQQALTKESLETVKLAKIVGEPVQVIIDTLAKLEDEDLVYNLGFRDSPVWMWRVGDDVDTTTLTEVVKRLISERPMWTREIVRATGAKESRVSGALVEIQRTCRVGDFSGGGHGKKYFVLGDHFKDATLPPKQFRGKPINHGRRAQNQNGHTPK